MSTWQSSYATGDRVEILAGFADGERWHSGTVAKRSAEGTIIVLLDGGSGQRQQVTRKSDIRLVSQAQRSGDPLAAKFGYKPNAPPKTIAEERAACWPANVRATLTVENELGPLRVAVMERDVHKLRAVADALAQAVQVLVSNAQYLEETEGKS